MTLRTSRLSSALAATLICGCQSDEPPPECDFVRGAVGLDEVIPAGAGGEILPRDVVEPISQVITGELEWKGERIPEWVSVTPNSGSTSFTSSASVRGDIIYSRVPGATGNTLLRCAPTLEFDVEIDFQTADGTLDERWEGKAAYSLSSFSGPSVEIDAEAEGIPEKLNVELSPSPPQPVFNIRYQQRLLYVADPADPKLEGDITLLGDFETERDGEIIHEGGIFLDLASWSNIE